MNDDRLREAYERILAARRPGDRAGCPPVDALLAVVEQRGPEAARLATLDHTMACAPCQQDFELLRAIHAAERREARATGRQRRWRAPAALALAAALLIAIGLGPGRAWLDDRGTDTMRGDTNAVVLLLPDASATAGGDSLRFAWRPVPETARYTVELLTLEGSVVLSATTTDTMAVLRGARDVAPGEYRWWVRAALPGGERRSEARPVTLRRE